MSQILESIKESASLSSRSFFLLWILTYVVSWLVTGTLAYRIPILFLIFGIIVGAQQWYLMRHQISSGWIILTGIGLAVGYSLSLFIIAVISFAKEPGSGSEVVILGCVIGGALGGGIAGFLQWIELRRYFNQARLWILTVPVAWIAGLCAKSLLSTIEFTARDSKEIDQIINSSIVDAIITDVGFYIVVGIITGFVLIWLRYKPTPNKVIKFTPYGVISLYFVVFAGVGYLFVKPKSVQIVVPEESQPIVWFMSPEGDQIIYDSMSSDIGGPRLLSLKNKQQFLVGNCDRFQWLDNTTLICFEYRKNEWSLVNITDWQSTEQTSRKYLDEVNIEQFLRAEDFNDTLKIYRLQQLRVDVSDNLLIMEPGNNHNTGYVVTGIENVDKLLEDVNYISLNLYNIEQVKSEDIYSPNGEYYYRLDRNKLAIYDRTGELLSEFDLGDQGDYTQSFEIGGWAADSSGVFFKFPTQTGLSGWYNREPIRKLLVKPE